MVKRVSPLSPKAQPAKKPKTVGKDSPSAKAAAAKKRPAKKDEDKADKGDASGKEAKRAKKDQKKAAQVVALLIEGNPGVAAPRPLPLSSLTKHKDVAWQWMEGGKMQYPIPIGCKKPLSPFNSEDD
eukprot:gb/GFBE01044208.1/.p1 GENE.gb/GFBE01044208.1/~~gb/GFBE01044208.1/.p1  ORF type:complete len:127 (+),score=41.49 gb/GFBE01044208.1/:1-381(+)